MVELKTLMSEVKIPEKIPHEEPKKSGKKKNRKKRPSKMAEKSNSEEVSADNLNKVKKQLDAVEEEHKRLDYAQGIKKQLGKVEVEQKQEGAKENSEIVENKGETEKKGRKRYKKRNKKNTEKEEGANKSSGERQMVNGEKGAQSKGMEGETNVKKQKTAHTSKEINNFVEMNTGDGKPMGKRLRKASSFFGRSKEKRAGRDAEEMKIDQGISEIDKVEMGQEGAKEKSHLVESKSKRKKNRRKERKNQNREKEEGTNKSSGEGLMVNEEKGAVSKGIEGETNVKKEQTIGKF